MEGYAVNLRCYRLDTGDGFPMGYHLWELGPSFRAAIRAFPEAPSRDNPNAWEYVQVVPLTSWHAYDCGNDGAQGWRHRATGYAIPDYCRQTGGCPEVWTHTTRRQLTILEDSPILRYLAEW